MRIKIITYGCTSNKADSELMAGLLNKKGHRIVNSKPDLTIINTCVVKQPTERKIIKKLDSLKGRRVVVSGCLPQAMPQLINNYPEFSFIGVNQCTNIVELIKHERMVNLERTNDSKLCKPLLKTNPVIGIIPISEGCLSNCSYCISRIARGFLKSNPVELILKQMRLLKTNEYCFTGQDTGCYGIDINSSLPELINEAVKLKHDYRIRVGMMNPKFALKNLEELVNSFDNTKVFKFLHIPVQSGSNRILKLMGRGYTVNDFKKVVKAFRSKFPRITISTDVICGYPDETDKDFNETVNLINWLKPDVLNISRFWPRPGTKASTLKQVNGRLTKQRSRLMTGLFKRMVKKNNDSWVSWEGSALIDEEYNGFVARNDYYKPIVLKKGVLGKRVKIKVTESNGYYLTGKII